MRDLVENRNTNEKIPVSLPSGGNKINCSIYESNNIKCPCYEIRFFHLCQMSVIKLCQMPNFKIVGFLKIFSHI